MHLQATLLLVLAAGLSLPLAASSLLLAAEVAFAVAVRLRSSAYGQQQKRSRGGSRSAAPAAGCAGSAAVPDTTGAQALLQKLLDPAVSACRFHSLPPLPRSATSFLPTPCSHCTGRAAAFARHILESVHAHAGCPTAL
jgi:hypothetical protein